MNTFQLGFISGHGTKIALIGLVDGLWWEQDRVGMFIGSLLHLAAAFNTIDHSILLDHILGLVVGWHDLLSLELVPVGVDTTGRV